MKRAFLRLRNAFDYPLRQWLAWRRKGFRPARAGLENLFEGLPPAERSRAASLARRLRADYHLAAFAQDSTPGNFRENLFYLHLLETAFECSSLDLPASLRAADIGPSHWFYVQAEYAALRWWRCPLGRELRLEAYEADPYRVYADLRSRMDHAIGHMRGLPGVEYTPRAFTSQPGAFDLILMLFPFVFEEDHLEWGLPGRMFQPRDLLRAAWDSLSPGGLLVIVNQGEREHAAERRNLAALEIPVRAAFEQDALLFSYDMPRFGLTAVRPT